jgi:hypothetical protein
MGGRLNHAAIGWIILGGSMSGHPAEPPTVKLEAFYEKANFFRVIHSDGVYGGATPQGNMHFAFYSERSAIPRHVEFDVTHGVPGPERVIEAKKGIFREIEADVVMSFGGALQFYIWLGGQLETMRQALGIPDDAWRNMLPVKR